MGDKRLKIPQITITVSDSVGKTVKVRKYGPFIFKKTRNKWKNDSGESWALKDKSHKEWGSIYVAKRSAYDPEAMCVCNSHIDDKLHGLGIGLQLYKHLVDYYSVLESDPNGLTSEKATKVWKRMGATILSHKNWSQTKRYRVVSKVNPPKEKTWTGTTFTWNMKNWLSRVISTPGKYLSKISSRTRFRKRSTALWID